MDSTLNTEVKKALLELLVGSSEPKAPKGTPKYVIVVDGYVSQQRPRTAEEVKQATIAVKLRNPQAKIEVYTFERTAEITLPVDGFEPVAADTDQEA